jgi:hypothetical protein
VIGISLGQVISLDELWIRSRVCFKFFVQYGIDSAPWSPVSLEHSTGSRHPGMAKLITLRVSIMTHFQCNPFLFIGNAAVAVIVSSSSSALPSASHPELAE